MFSIQTYYKLQYTLVIEYVDDIVPNFNIPMWPPTSKFCYRQTTNCSIHLSWSMLVTSYQISIFSFKVVLFYLSYNVCGVFIPQHSHVPNIENLVSVCSIWQKPEKLLSKLYARFNIFRSINNVFVTGVQSVTDLSNIEILTTACSIWL